MTSTLRRALIAPALGAVLLSAACGTSMSTGSSAAPSAAPAPPSPGTVEPAPEATAESAASPVSFAFVGDIHATGASEAVLDEGLGDVADLLAEHDVVVGNLETAIVTDPAGTRAAPKQYTFRAPRQLLEVLHANGIDAVTLANNHGMDFGDGGLQQTLGAAASSPLALIGAGQDEAAAYAPWVTEVDGTRVAVLAATDVLDSFALETWPAGDAEPGLASSKGEREQRLLDAVESAAEDADVVAVYLHWGVEREVCPTDRQQALARAVAAAGADVVVGSHAHVVQPAGEVAGTFVHYGLGNFIWYAREGSPSARTGVLSVRVSADDTTATWHDARISGGIPRLTGEAGEPPTSC